MREKEYNVTSQNCVTKYCEPRERISASK